MAKQEWADNPKQELSSVNAPVTVPWAVAINKHGIEVKPPKMVDKTGKEFDRPDIVDSDQPTRKFTFAEVKAQDTLVRKRIRAEKLRKEEAVKKHMESLKDA